MCYRCEVCDGVVPRGRPRLLHVVHRRVPHVVVLAGVVHNQERTDIAKEWAVCRTCKELLANGMPLWMLLQSSYTEIARASEALHRERLERDEMARHTQKVLAQVRRNGLPMQIIHTRERPAQPELPKKGDSPAGRKRRLPMTPPAAAKRLRFKGTEEQGAAE